MATIEFTEGQKAIVQVFHGDSDAIAGTGFWVGGRYLITCAHVVEPTFTESLEDVIGRLVNVAFHQAKHPEKLSARVIDYQYDDRESGRDVAVLRLSEDIKFDIAAIYLDSTFQRYIDAGVRLYGYLKGNSVGRNVKACTNGSAGDWVQLEVLSSEGNAIEEGLSGSPVWCADSFVGIVVARDQLCSKNQIGRVGFMIPSVQLQSALRLIHRSHLQDILEPCQTRLATDIAVAYHLSCNEHASNSTQQRPLADRLTALVEMAAGSAELKTKTSGKLVHFVASLLNALELQTYDPEIQLLTAHLMNWVQPLTDDIEAIRLNMRNAALEKQQQLVTPLNPILLVSIRDKTSVTKSILEIDAWLIRDPIKYQNTGKGSERLFFNSLGEVHYSDLCVSLAGYLDRVGEQDIALEDLTIELFLPDSLINEPIEQLEIPFMAISQPLGMGFPNRPKVLVRSQSRLAQSRANRAWKNKWEQISAHLKTPASEKFIGKTATFQKDLFSYDTLGLKLCESLSVENEMSYLILTGTPLALWIRNNQADCDWARSLDLGILYCPLEEVLEKILRLREASDPMKSKAEYAVSSELAHHLAVLWENPYHVPPNIVLSSAKL